ncbi:DUF4245 domain-containing protein [Gordonia sp. LSe1-13]|uniref:DUF4245 domain-containing protein n=1 Tax=Gordonia sesuvii TaxID=3116777 RepID=A0ABU7M726_9ACTN|nr:DUF4245 domain-containing protein [Gordonia sp. LSe1-13]
MADKPRILHSGKDMLWSLIPLLVICAFVAIASGNCSVGLTGQAGDDQTPDFDVTTALQADARDLTFPIRLPDTPDGWKPNSGSTVPVGGTMVSNAGWISEVGAYVQLSQTDAAEDDLVVHLGDGDALGTGTRQVAGREWVTYVTAEEQKFWITDLGDVRIAVLSRGPDEDMATLATATLAKEPLPA